MLIVKHGGLVAIQVCLDEKYEEIYLSEACFGRILLNVAFSDTMSIYNRAQKMRLFLRMFPEWKYEIKQDDKLEELIVNELSNAGVDIPDNASK